MIIYADKISIMDREKQLSILYQKQGRATQFSSKADRDKWLQKEIDDLQRILSSNFLQVSCSFCTLCSALYCYCLSWKFNLKQTSLKNFVIANVILMT